MSNHAPSEPFADWSPELLAEFEANQQNGHVGMTLLDENEYGRVWSISMKPGERCGFHRHVLNYFWICVSGGKARSHFADGSTRYPEYGVGEYCELRFEAGDSLMHDLENIGDEDLVFTTVEYFASPNQPLSLD